MLKIAFWVSVGFVTYTYLGYPVLVYLLSKTKPAAGAPPARPIPEMPFVTVIIPAYNEERWIRRKIENTLALDYPREKLQIVVASDGSTDHTVQLANEFVPSGIEVAAFPARQGKQEMLNQLVPRAAGEIIVATDTQAMLEPNALRFLVRHFADPQVGGATGRRVCVVQTKSTPSVGESLYWRYDSWIKNSESLVHSCVGAHGQLYAIRRDVFPHVARVGEDFYIPMKVIADTGLRIIYEPAAVACIPAAANLSIEFERKIRAHVSLLLMLSMLTKILWPWRSPIWWQFVSHQLLRMAVPPALVAAFLSSTALAVQIRFYRWIALAQVLFYGLAGIGALFARYGKRPKLFFLPFYFVFTNAALALAWLRWPARRFEHAWQRTERLLDMD